MKKLGSVLCFVLINILLFLFSGVGFAGQEKVDVCHLTGTYQNEFSEIIELGHVINIADPAYHMKIPGTQYLIIAMPNNSKSRYLY